MKKRILAFICTLTLLIGLLPAGTASVVPAQAASAEATYDVGYAIKNFNPWVSSSFDVNTDVGTAEFLLNPEETADKKIYPYLFSQTGNQNEWESVVTQLHDDNGDGDVDHEDGIFATCTAVTYGKDTPEEKTVLFITTDTMKAWTKLVKAVRDKITASDWGKELGITADEIMVSANHTHSGPQLDGTFTYYIDSTVFDSTEKKTALKKDRETYYNWVVDRIVAAAEESVADRSPATMSKGAVDATEATAVWNYNGGKGYHMNAIRHYERSITATKKLFGLYELDSETIYSIYANTTVPSEQKLYNALLENQFEKAELFNPEQFLTDTSYTTSWSTTDEADNTMYVLRFEFEDSAKKPVAFVNWRAHSTMNSGILNHSVLSGDYATGLRTVLAEYGYRAAFFQGAAGNVVPDLSENVYKVDGVIQKDKMDWLYEATDPNDASMTPIETTKTFVYGRMLAEIALHCMKGTNTSGQSYMMSTPVGEISTYSTSWNAKKNKYDEQLLNAAMALRTEVMSAQGWNEATFDSSYNVFFKDKNNSSTYFPYYYKPSSKTVAIINSRAHFDAVYAQAKTGYGNVPDYAGAVELNAIMLGKNVAFITSPNELADYYHDFTDDVKKHSSDEKEDHNDWFKLEDDVFGMPFVLGYSNQSSGYIAGWLDHQANSATHATITGLGGQGHMLYSPGTYESMTSSFAAGQGEALMDVYNRMLDVASGKYDRNAHCRYCDADVVWKPLFAEDANINNLQSGHYYLYEDLNGTNTGGQWYVGSATEQKTICIDLMGHKKTSDTRNFIVYNGSVLSIYDSVGGGQIHGKTFSNNPGSGNFEVYAGGTVNLYGGTLSFEQREGFKDDNTPYYGVGTGGVMTLGGTLNMYGGTIVGGDLVDSTYTDKNTGKYLAYNGCGGAICVSGGNLNVYGGTITSGSVPETVTTGNVNNKETSAGKGPCVFLATAASKVKLSGDAKVDNIYYNRMGGAMLTVSEAYTGTTSLTFDPSISIVDNMDIGDSSNAVLTGSTITCTNNPLANIYVQGTDLKLPNVTDKTVAVVCDANGVRACDSVTDAISKFTTGNSIGSNAGYIKLIKNETAPVSVSKDVNLDLAGFSVTGQVTVAEGKTLYCRDSNTDDYTVKDGKGYGKIASYTGKIAGVPEEAACAEDGYVMVTEADGVSFHRLNLQLKAMTLRPQVGDKYEPGIYYKSYFAGDEMVAEQIDTFGVALSLIGTPTEATLNTKCRYSVFNNFVGGVQNADDSLVTGTLLKGIMKETNLPLQNATNANRMIYGRAYAKLKDGTYLFGTGASRTLRQQVEAIDAKWDKLTDDQRTNLTRMCENFESVTKNWNIPNIKKAIQSGEA